MIRMQDRELAEPKTGKRQAGRLLVSFFVVMLVFTLVSRWLDAFTVAGVTVVYPSSGALTRTIRVDGAVLAGEGTAVSVPAGFLVSRVLVESGARVAAGDPLAVLDTADIEAKLKAARRELEAAWLAASVQAVPGEDAALGALEEARRGLERAREDLAAAETAAKAAVARAQEDLGRARRERWQMMQQDDYGDAELEAYKSEIRQRERAVEDAERNGEASIVAARRAVEDAEKAIDLTEDRREEKENTDTARDANREIASRQSALLVAEKQSRVTELQALLTAEGVVAAERDGVITGRLLEPGTVTSGGGAFLLDEQQGGMRFRGTVEPALGKHLAVGDRAELRLAGAPETVAARIAVLEPPKEKGGDYTVTVELPELDIPAETAGTLTVEKKSSETGVLLPLSALYTEHGSTTQGYVFVLREQSTTMGAQTVVARMPVEIRDRNEKAALLSAVFEAGDRVVAGSSRSLTDGDRVRYAAE